MALPFPEFTADHIHPILVNFTAALVPTSVASDVAGRIFHKASLQSAAWWMLVYATAITPFTCLAGLWWKSKLAGTLPTRPIAQHLWLGIALTVAFIILLLWRHRAYRRAEPPSFLYFTFAAIIIVALLIQGSLGRQLLMS